MAALIIFSIVLGPWIIMYALLTYNPADFIYYRALAKVAIIEKYRRIKNALRRRA